MLYLLFCIVVLAAGVCCGSGHPPRLDGRIVGGEFAQISNHPYQVSLRVNNIHICGGSIIGKSTVLTAAHCILEGKYQYSILVGSSVRTSGGQSHDVSKVIIHREFNPRTYDYDVAIIRVKKQFKFNNNVNPIALQEKLVVEGTPCNVTGWGSIAEGTGTEKYLRVVTVKVVGNPTCENIPEYSQFTDRMLCAGDPNGGKDSCQGDSGGPLVANGKQIGIVSWGYGCAQPAYPGVYTNVSALREWIKENNGIQIGSVQLLVTILATTHVVYQFLSGYTV